MNIKDIPVLEIENFLGKNNITYDTNNMYEKAFDLIKNEADYYPISIIEWIKAYNLIKSKVDVPFYYTDDLESLDQNKLTELSKLLTLKTTNMDHIINILKYMGKLKVKKLIDDIDYDIIKKLYGSKLANFLKKYDFKIILVNEIIKNNLMTRIKTLREGKQVGVMNYFIYPTIDSIFKGPSGSFDFKDKIYGTILMNKGTLSDSSTFKVPFGEEYYYEKYGKELLTNDEISDYENLRSNKGLPELEELLIQLNEYY